MVFPQFFRLAQARNFGEKIPEKNPMTQKFEAMRTLYATVKKGHRHKQRFTGGH
jgi:hypothetical protein